MIFNIPNIISFSRIAIAPLFLFFFLSEKNDLVILSAPIFLIGALSDWLDGWIARKYNQSSKWGIFIDPLADKILILSAFVAFVYVDIIPFWMVLIIAIRDIFMTFLRLFADSHNMLIITKQIAKIKTVFQFIIIAYILSLFFFGKLKLYMNYYNLIYHDIVYYSMLCLTLFTVWTMVIYILDNKPIIYKLFGFERKT